MIKSLIVSVSSPLAQALARNPNLQQRPCQLTKSPLSQFQVIFAVLALVAAASAQYYGYSSYGYPSYSGYGSYYGGYAPSYYGGYGYGR